jgi:hypothetical protein
MDFVMLVRLIWLRKGKKWQNLFEYGTEGYGCIKGGEFHMCLSNKKLVRFQTSTKQLPTYVA